MANESRMYVKLSLYFLAPPRQRFIAYIMKMGTTEMKVVDMSAWAKKGRGRK